MNKKFISILFCILLIINLIGCSNTKTTTSVNNTVKQDSVKQTVSISPDEERYLSVLKTGKSYMDLSIAEKKIISEMINRWDSQSQEFRSNYINEKEILQKQRNNEIENEIKESRSKYAEFINEVQSMCPEMKVDAITDSLNGGKTLTIYMQLLENKDSTQYKCAELTVKKETAMKNIGITEIDIFIKNNEKDAGFIFFELESGEYKPTINEIK